jgi:RND family efflux transporter MFP subunit
MLIRQRDRETASCRLLAAGLAILAIASLSSCGKPEPDPAEELRPVRYVVISSVGRPQLRSFPGAATASVESRLSFRVAGTVLSIPVAIGDAVSAGQLIAQLDARDYELKVEEVRAALAQAEAQARNARASFERVRALYENDNASLQEYDAARALSESATAQVRSVEKKLELAALQLDYTRLIAPAAGAIAAVNVDVNENVVPGQVIVLLTSREATEVDVDVPEGVIAEIERGSRAAVRFDAIPGQEFAARVSEVGVAPAEFATTYRVTVALDDLDPAIRPGMAAEVEFSLGGREAGGRLWVPPESVTEDREGRFVYTVEATGGARGVVRRRAVTVGEISSAGIEILSGLTDGNMIVTAGIGQLEDGDEVSLADAGTS